MKKIVITLFLLGGLATGVQAQLKVFDNGYVSLQTAKTPISPIAIGTAGFQDCMMAMVGTDLCGMRVNMSKGSQGLNYVARFNARNFLAGKDYIGVYGMASSSYTRSHMNYGVMGNAGCAESGFGVFGHVSDCTTGAAVYGTTQNDYGYYMPANELFAGYFNGNVKVTGNLAVNGTIDGVLLGTAASGAATSGTASAAVVQSLGAEQASMSSRMSGLVASVYQKERPVATASRAKAEQAKTSVKSEAADSADEEDDDDINIDLTSPGIPINNCVEEQFYEKAHYALDADQLEAAFPDLVYEQADGTKAINYLEMIPLLVQSINELNAEIAALKGLTPGGGVMKAAARTTGISTTPVAATASLQQNTPNPFTERTEIRFSLPDDARNAFIYIFDMQGKLQKQLPIDASMQSVTVNGYELQPGLYLYSLVIGGQEIDTKRMILSR